ACSLPVANDAAMLLLTYERRVASIDASRSMRRRLDLIRDPPGRCRYTSARLHSCLTGADDLLWGGSSVRQWGVGSPAAFPSVVVAHPEAPPYADALVLYALRNSTD